MVCNTGTVKCNNFFVVTAAPLSLPELLSLLQLLVVFIINLSAFYPHLNNRSLCWVFEINLVVFGKKKQKTVASEELQCFALWLLQSLLLLLLASIPVPHLTNMQIC